MAIKQRFLYFFAGDDIDTDVWQTRDVQGTGTFGMNDAVNGGYGIEAGTADNDQSGIDFNDINQYSNNSSVVALTVQRTVTDSLLRCGLMNGTVHPVNHNRAFVHLSNTGFYNTETGSGSNASTSASTVALDNNTYHNHKLVLGGSNVLHTIDGILEVTKTDNLPTTKLSPTIRIRATEPSATAKLNILNYEAFNT